MVIKIPRQKLERIDYRLWEPLQGDLKILYDKNYKKLKKSFEENGGFLPAFIWKQIDQKGEVRYKILDAHQRKSFFDNEQAQFEWEDDPGELSYEYPCVIIEAKNLQDAARKLLVTTSQFGTMTQEGLDEFSSIFEIEDDWLSDTSNFDNIFTEIPEEFDPVDSNSKNESPKNKIVLEYSEEDFRTVKEAFDAIDGSKENIVYELLVGQPIRN